jgi:hypothetical protein
MYRTNSANNLQFETTTTSAAASAFEESTAPNGNLAHLMRGAILLTGTALLAPTEPPLTEVATPTDAKDG